MLLCESIIPPLALWVSEKLLARQAREGERLDRCSVVALSDCVVECVARGLKFVDGFLQIVRGLFDSRTGPTLLQTFGHIIELLLFVSLQSLDLRVDVLETFLDV